MEMTNRTDDELLSAYIDGEIPADEAATLVTRLANEPALVKRLETMRGGDDAVRAVYKNLDQVPMPDGVTQLLDIGHSEAEDSNSVAFRPRGISRVANFPFAIVASVALVAGFLALRQVDVDPALSAVDSLVAGNLDADSAMHEFLETGVSGEPEMLGDSAEMRIVLSFESEGGNYCRQLYVAATDHTVHGVACRNTSGWQLEAVATGAPAAPGGQFQAASTDTPKAVSGAIDSLIGARDPLSRDEENLLIADGWKKSSD